MSDKELKESEEGKDATNWSAWYLGLAGFLVAQIILYLWITNMYAS